MALPLGGAAERLQVRRPERIQLGAEPREPVGICPVEPTRTVDADDDEAGVAEHTQMLARGRLLQTRERRKVPCRALPLEDAEEHRPTPWVRDHLEHVRHLAMVAATHIS